MDSNLQLYGSIFIFLMVALSERHFLQKLKKSEKANLVSPESSNYNVIFWGAFFAFLQILSLFLNEIRFLYEEFVVLSILLLGFPAIFRNPKRVYHQFKAIILIAKESRAGWKNFQESSVPQEVPESWKKKMGSDTLIVLGIFLAFVILLPIVMPLMMKIFISAIHMIKN